MFWPSFAVPGTGCLKSLKGTAKPKTHSLKTLNKWPSITPALNPMEHLWKELNHAVWGGPPSNRDSWSSLFMMKWVKLHVDRCRRRTESYRNLLIAMIASKRSAKKCYFKGPSC